MVKISNILAIVLAFGLLVNVLNKFIIYYTFLLQRDHIIKNLCEQRYEEENTCQGCCQLDKQLEKASEDTESEIPFPTTKIKNISEVIPNTLLQKQLFENPPSIFQYTLISFYSYRFFSDVFHPPRNFKITFLN